jgi:hypothetical protein
MTWLFPLGVAFGLLLALILACMRRELAGVLTQARDAPAADDTPHDELPEQETET